MPDSVLIQVDYFREGGFWIVGASLYETDDGPDDPMPFDDTEDFRDEERALHHAENLAQWIVATKQAGRATILKNGNEHLCLTV